MSKATALKVSAGILVLVLLVSAYPLADLAVRQFSDAPAPAAVGTTPQGGFELPFGPGELPSSSETTIPLPERSGDGASSRPGSSPSSPQLPATGSAVLDQVLGAARLLGHDVQVPDLPVHKLAAEDPLRHAILAWIAATGSVVPPAELTRELARADAMPETLQRDLALVVLSAAEATLLQRAALSALTAEEVAWVYAHPELAEDLVSGVETEDTLRLAELAAKVDTAKSIQAALLLLQAVEATRGSLQDAPDAKQTLLDLGLDEGTRDIIQHLALGPGTQSDADKIRFAADLVALTSSLPLERAAVEPVAFNLALQRLLGATEQPVLNRDLAVVLARAETLPADLQGALGALLDAQAGAIVAANPAVATPEGQAAALVRVLDAAAFASPTLSKYGLYWSSAPEALRVGQWDGAVRAKWAAEHAALLLSARGDATQTTRAALVAAGLPLPEVSVPDRTLAQALTALVQESGGSVTPEMARDFAAASATLPPQVVRAAATLVSGAAEAERLSRIAYAQLSPEDRAFLLGSAHLSDLYLKDHLTADELADLARLARVSGAIDRAALAEAAAVGVLATSQAAAILDGAGNVAVQGEATPVATGWRALLARLLPFGMARAQSAAVPCTDISPGDTSGRLYSDCENDVLLVVDLRDDIFGQRQATAGTQLLVITGAQGTIQRPVERSVFFPTCPDGTPATNNGMTWCFRDRFAIGASKVHLDLGGNDNYLMPVAMTLPAPLAASDGRGSVDFGFTGYASIHFDYGGTDVYADPTSIVRDNPEFALTFGETGTHPTQGSAMGGGVAILYEHDGGDIYEAPGRSQGYARYGFGALIDRTGDDSYSGGRFSQGASSETLNVGAALLLDREGRDFYTSSGGQGFGLGAFFLDLSGEDDRYEQPNPALGAPLFKLDVIPGGDLATLDERANNRLWIDGPDGFNVGLAVDQEVGISGFSDNDRDFFLAFVEEIAGSDPDNDRSTPVEAAGQRVEEIRADSDGDGWSDAIERTFSSDADDATSYPAGFPAQAAPSGANTPKGGDKILDLRLPLQDAGSIDPACSVRRLNSTVPILPESIWIPNPLVERPTHVGVTENAAPGGTETCIFLRYESANDGTGVVGFPATSGGGANLTYETPLGIFALGDVVNTRYTVDYFAIIDLGGADVFENGAGGALPVAIKPLDTKWNIPASPNFFTHSYLAPSLAISVDRDASRASVDRYLPLANRTTFNQAQGSLYGVLIDTNGNDHYVAGNSSQGSQGGALLDLGGADTYRAGDLSQGASIAQPAPTSRIEGVPAAGRGPSTDSPLRRSIPGLLLDYGAEADNFTAKSHSQGSARGWPYGSPTPTDTSSGRAVFAYGILYNQGGNDVYSSLGGIHSQGVGSTRSIGLLFDRDGSDIYEARGIISHGATVSQTYQQGAQPATAYEPGAGLLVDLGGTDNYTYVPERSTTSFDRTQKRQDALTRTSGNAAPTFVAGANANAYLYADQGIHLDTSSGTFESSIAGSPSPRNGRGFALDMPSARFAIGTSGATTYTADYAFILDLGGHNEYHGTAGGFLPDVVARVTPVPGNGAARVSDPTTLSLYPVTFLLDTGSTASVNSTYRSPKGLNHGAGYFGVGVLADLGGSDVLVVENERLPAVNSTWMTSSLTLDGILTPSEWAGAQTYQLDLVGMSDSRFSRNVTVRLANDENNLYIGLVVPTSSPYNLTVRDRLYDYVVIDLDSHHDRSDLPVDGYAGIDGLTVKHDTTSLDKPGPCITIDRASRTSNGVRVIAPDDGGPDANDVRAACTLDAGGAIVYEIVKPIGRSSAIDAGDLGIRNISGRGLEMLELGLRIEVGENIANPQASTTGERFAWPAGTTNTDGQAGFRLDNTLADELTAWGALGLTNSSLGKPFEPIAERQSTLSQGAGLAGVGILAMLGNADSSSTLVASSRAQGFGAFGGLGLLFDAGGSDVYTGDRLVQAAAETGGVGALVDLEGNDNYRSNRESLAYSSGNGVAFFADLEGVDEYVVRIGGLAPADVETESIRDSRASGSYPDGNQRVWTRRAPALGIGMDANSERLARDAAAGVESAFTFMTDTRLQVMQYVPAEGNIDDCSTPVAPRDGKPLLRGIVCLRAQVDVVGAANSGVQIDSVDFLIDGVRHPGELITWGAASSRSRIFAVLLDSADLEDGVRQIQALANVRFAQAPLLAYRDSESPAISVQVDNAPRPQLSLEPTLQDDVLAGFSPVSATRMRELLIDWSVNRDAGEDRLTLHQGWRAPAWNTNIPCALGTDQLCTVLPFYFHGGTMTPEPSANLYPTPVTETPGSSIVGESTARLSTHLDIMKDDAFRVYLHDRQALRNYEFQTYARVTLRDGVNDVKIPGTNTPLVLAEGYFFANRTASTSSAAATFLNARMATTGSDAGLAPLRALCASIPACAAADPLSSLGGASPGVATASTGGSGNGWDELVLDAAPIPAGLEHIVESFDDHIRIKPGYAVRLDIVLLNSQATGGNGGNVTRDTYNPAVRDPAESAAPPLKNPPRPLDRDQELRGVDAALRNTNTNPNSLTGGLVAARHFRDGAGAPSRLELRIPSEPTTSATIGLHHVATNRTYTHVPERLVEGDVLGSRGYTDRSSPFDGTIGGVVVPDGLYVARLDTVDAAGNAASINESFLLDRLAPRSVITTPATIGKPLLVDGNKIPVRWTVFNEESVSSSGIAATYLYARKAGEATWTAIGGDKPTAFYAGENRFDYVQSSGNKFEFLTVSVDRAGNYEGITTQHASGADARQAAVAAKTAAGHFNTVTIDTRGPVITAAGMSGGKLLNHRGQDVMFLSDGSKGQFTVTAQDPDRTPLSRVNISFVYVDPITNAVTSKDRTVCAPCGGSTQTWAMWNTQDKSEFPDGLWAVMFDVYDQGSNRATALAGSVLLDSVAPELDLQPVVYPTDQAAGKLGDRLRLRLQVYDEFGINPSTLRVDASAISTDGIVEMRPVRVQGVIYQEAVVTLDRADVSNGVYALPVVVEDHAGNKQTGVFDVLVDFRTFEFVPGSLRVTNATHDSITLEWETTEPTNAQVRFGTGPFDLRSRTVLKSAFDRNHSVVVTGLDASTRYFLRPVSSGVGGYTLEGDVVEGVTDSALRLAGVSPSAGDAVSGAFAVLFRGGLVGSDDFVTYSLEVRSGGAANYTFVTTTTARGENHSLTFNSSRYLDGANYTLRLTAEAGNERDAVELGPFTIDNTLPLVTVVTPLVATNDTTPRILAEVRDTLAGVPADRVEVLLDGEALPAPRIEVVGGALTVRLDLEEPLTAGEHEFAIRAVDRAGNEIVERWTVLVDAEAPLVSVNPVSYEPGPTAAKAGSRATINVTATDVGGVASVLADTSAVSSQASTRLFRVIGTDYWIGSFVVTAAQPTATVPIPLVAVDFAGNQHPATATLVVDNEPPVVGEFTTRSTEHTRAVIGTTASEPVRLVASATAPGSPTVEAQTTELSAEPRLTFTGLLPSRTYTYSVKALDRAGNAIESVSRFQTSQDATPPGEVGGLSVTDLLNGTLRLTWTPATDDIGVSHYRVYRSDNGVDFSPVAESTETIYEDSRLPLERAFTYQVVAVDHGGNEGPGAARLRAIATALPILVDGAVSPTMGSSSTTFKYAILYQSPGGVAPAYVRVVLDGVPQDMVLVGEPDFVNGARYEYETRLAPHTRDSPHTYAFEASDGRYTVRFPVDGEPMRGPLVSGDMNADREATSFANFAKNVPLGGAAGALSGILIAALAVAIVLRRKKEGSQ